MGKRGIIFLFLVITFSGFASAGLNYSAQWSQNLTGANVDPAIAFGDIDNDGDLDLITLGCILGTVDVSCTGGFEQTKVYINNGTTLTENQTWQQNLSSSFETVVLGDIDNDGDLDLIILNIQKVYINNGTSFVENSTWQINLTIDEPTPSSVALGDVDNDGDLDLVMTGFSSTNPSVYINNGTSFVGEFWVDNSLRDTREAVTLIDVNSDTYLDLISAGNNIGGLYLNNGSAFNVIDEDVASMDHVSSVAGDFDNDGDMDMIEMGLAAGDATFGLKNNGSSLLRNTLWEISGESRGSLSVGDYDNDGDLDLFRIGGDEVDVFDNNGTLFIANATSSANFTADSSTSTAWIDIDNDGDLDLAIIFSGVTWIYTNDITTPNQEPTPPNDFSYLYNNKKIYLGWLNGSDTETNYTGLYYNLKLGTLANNHSIISGIYGGSANPTAGYFGNMMQRKNFTLNTDRLSPSTTYYWSVQSIDTGLKAGSWSDVQNFTTGADLTSPVITLNSPVDNSNLSSYSVVFNVSVTDNSNLDNVSLWGNWKDGTWSRKQINNSGINNTDYIFSETINRQQSFQWHIEACDNSTNCGNSSTRTFSIDIAIGLIENQTWSENLVPGASFSAVAVLGDIDNDGDLDMISTGCQSGSGSCTTSDKSYVYVNNGTTFINDSTWEQNLSESGSGSIALGDIDNDGDLDLILSAIQGSADTRIYINNGTTFAENFTWQNNLLGNEGASSNSVALGDIDHDGDLDLIFPGMEKNRVFYINNGTSFENSSTWGSEIIDDTGKISTGLADFDNDGDLDLNVLGVSSSKSYINNGTSFVYDINWGTSTRDESNVAWGDYDNDGDFDYIVSSFTSTRFGINNGTLFLKNPSPWYSVSMGIVSWGSMMLGDYDNNGYLDLLNSGNSAGPTIEIGKNNGSAFIRDSTAEANLSGVQKSSVIWGDVDNDNDLDLISINDLKIYISNASLTNPNTEPTPPNGFSYSYNNRKISLGWLNGSDNETSSTGLYYNLKLGTVSNNHSIISGIYGGSGDASRGGTAFGYFGNMMQRKNFTLNTDRLSPSTTYYWSVQSIDTGLKAGSWSDVQNFTTGADLTSPVITLNSPVDNANLSSYSVVFNATVTDNSNLDNVSLWGNWTGTFQINETNNSGINNTEYIFTKDLTEFGDGTYSWLIQARDNETNVINSSIMVFTIDATLPGFSNNQTNTTLAGASVNFSILWNDSIALHPNGGYIFSTNNTGIWVNETGVNFTATPEWANVTKTLNSTVGTLVGFQWYANDSVGNINNTEIFTLVATDTTKPQPEFGTNPIDVLNSSNSSVTFDFKAFDNLDIDYIKLYGNWSEGWHANYTNTSYTSDTYLNITVNSFPDGKYIWGIFANDSTGNTNLTLTNRTFTIDTVKPSLTSISSSADSTTATITWTSDEISDSTVYYGITIATTETQTSSSNVTSHSVDLSGLSTTTLYYYNVSSCDLSNNCNTSTQNSFTTSAASSSSSSGGSGGGSITITQPKEFDVDFSDVPVGDSKSLKSNQGEIKTFSFNNQVTHKITLSEITETSIKLIIESEPIIVILNVGENKSIDINEDNINDLEIKLISIISGKAELLLTKLEGADALSIEELEDKARKEALFDVKVSVLEKFKSVLPGEEVSAEIELFNVNNIGQVDVVVDYYISDNNVDGNKTILVSASDSLAVEAVTSFVRSLIVPEDVKSGRYFFVVDVTYKNIVTSSNSEFKVKSKQIDFIQEKFKEITIAVIVLIAIAIFVYLGRLRFKEKRLERKIKIVEKKMGNKIILIKKKKRKRK